MRRISSLGVLWLATLLLLAGWPARAHADRFNDTLQVHGYGSWSYRRIHETGYVYQDATSEGNYTNVSATLNISAEPFENIRTLVQANWTLSEDRTLQTILLPNPSPFAPPGAYTALPTGGVNTTPVSKVELDYAFGEWKFDDAFRVRAGQVKLPFGRYTEIYDVGTLRPFLDLPAGIYGDQAVVAEAYQGGGITGYIRADEWGFQYDVYIGQVIADLAQSPTNTVKTQNSDALGLRFQFFAPIEGLMFGVSAFGGRRSGNLVPTSEQGTVGAHLEYVDEAWIFRAEGIFAMAQDVYKTVGAYGEIAYKFDCGVQLAGRVDFYKPSFDNVILKISLPKTAQRHLDLGYGLNYWFSQNFVIKSSYHFVYGNRYASPANLGAIIVFGVPYFGPPLDDTNHVFEAGVQFSF